MRAVVRLVMHGSCQIVLASALSAQDLDVQVKPGAEIVDARVAQLVISTKKPTDLTNATLSIEVPAEFKAAPSTIRYSGGTRLQELVSLQRVDATATSGTRAVLVRLRNDNGVLADRSIEIQYVNSTLTAKGYLLFGVLGLFVGYAIKLGMKAVSAVPAPIAATERGLAAERGPEHPLVTFVRNHYYAVDFVITLLVGILVLLANLTGVVPPAGTRWPAALITGAGIGALANNELVGRITRR